MRIQSIVITALLAAASFGAYAATEDKSPAKDDGAGTAAASQDTSPTMDMKAMEEMMQQHKPAASSTDGKQQKVTAAQDRTKHFHPRDGK